MEPLAVEQLLACLFPFGGGPNRVLTFDWSWMAWELSVYPVMTL